MTTTPTVSGEPLPPGGSSRPGSWRRRTTIRVLMAAGILVVLAGLFGGVAAWRGGQADADNNDPYPTSLASVMQGTLTSVIWVDGTLGYAGSYSIVNHLPGVITWLPSAGDVVNVGEVLFEVDGMPAVLLEGDAPAYRTLSEGMSGKDVEQLNASLVALGYASTSDIEAAPDQFTETTTATLQQLQTALGVEATGVLELGQAVFLPRPVRITSVGSTLGARVQPGGTVIQATSTEPVITVALNPAHQSRVDVGDAVTVTLPNRQTAEATVTAVGSVATAADSDGGGGPGGGGGNSPTIEVEVRLTDPSASGSFDQAPVSIAITTAVVEDVLAVPVTALVALAGGGHAVEVEHADGSRELIPVTTGLFDDSSGLVEISGGGLEAGQQVVVPGRS